MKRARQWIAFLLGAVAVLGAVAPSAGAADEFFNYGLESAAMSLSSTQAGNHADMTLSFSLKQKENLPYAKTGDIEITLPPGVIGNPQGIPTCSVSQLAEKPAESQCPRDSQVGVTAVTLGGNNAGTFVEPIYNMDPPGGEVVARFGFFAGFWPGLVNVRVNPIDYSLTATVEHAPSAADLLGASTTLWGVPADPSHNDQRLTPLEAIKNESPSDVKPGLPPAPFLSNPTGCSRQRQVTFTVRSYQLPQVSSSKTIDYPQIGGCEKLSFAPEFTAVPTNPEAAAPTGLDAKLFIPQDETPQGRATSTLKSATVALPEGISINPAAGDGLAACSAEQVGANTTSSSNCPDAAKIGSVEMVVPALERTLHGSVYQRSPEPGQLFRFWLVTDEQGVHLKLPAKIEANPITGQVITVFAGIDSLGGNPEVPFEELRLHIPGGPRAPLATPGRCGTYQTHFEFVPWSDGPATEGNAPMRIASGCGKGGFDPRLTAGTLSPKGGAFSPFVLTLTREDGEANPRVLSVHLPQGLLAKLGGVPLCPDSAAATGACPASSRIGRLIAASGVGGAPLWIPQPGKAPTAVFLAGPYRGAPYSVVSVVPAQAGPFDLGMVVNRAAIDVDPEMASATIRTDPLPQILEGVPIAYRAVNVLVDRPDFTLNPTSCNRKQIQATVTAANGATATPSAPFQASDCANLDFKPTLSLKLSGGTKRSAHPALKAVVTYPKGAKYANTAKASVAFPHSEFLEQAHIRTICTRVQFAADACPKGSIYGKARAISPLLDKPLEGPLYLRSSSNPLPDLVLALHGQIDAVAVARIDSHNGGIRTSFESVPDVPLSKVIVEMQGGKKGLLVNSRNICEHTNRATARFTGQNGKSHDFRPVLKDSCPGKHEPANRKRR